MSGPRRAFAAAVAAAALLPAAAAAQDPAPVTELRDQYPLDPSSTAAPENAAAAARRLAAAADDDGSGTAWVIAVVLGVAGVALTIAGLANARREPEAPAPPEPATGAARAPPRRRARPRRRPAAERTPRRPPPPAARADTRTPPSPMPLTPSPEFEECRVALVADGHEHRFVAALSGEGGAIARSPGFRARRASSLMESAAARDALQALVAGLLAAGWQVVGRDDDPWALRFRRRATAGRPVEHHPASR
jgi:hypothetical protein